MIFIGSFSINETSINRLTHLYGFIVPQPPLSQLKLIEGDSMSTDAVYYHNPFLRCLSCHLPHSSFICTCLKLNKIILISVLKRKPYSIKQILTNNHCSLTRPLDIDKIQHHHWFFNCCAYTSGELYQILKSSHGDWHETDEFTLYVATTCLLFHPLDIERLQLVRYEPPS